MRIVHAEVIPYALPFREPYLTARGTLERRELVLLRLTDSSGLVGIGETTSLSLRGGRTLASIVDELEEIAARLLASDGEGDARGAGARISVERFSPEARCAFSIAAEDLALRMAGRPYDEEPGAIEVNATLSSGAPTEVARAAEGWAERGFATFKLKLGAGRDVEQVKAVRRALGSSARIRVDANGAWGVKEAMATLDALEPVGLELCEQPVASLEEMALVREASAVPIAADESVADLEQARRAVEIGACDLVTLKLAKVGGPPEVAAFGEQLPLYMSSALDGPIGIVAAGHLAAELRRNGGDAGVAHGLATQLLFSDTIASSGPELRDGHLHLPRGHGFGVEIDERALDRLRLRGG